MKNNFENIWGRIKAETELKSLQNLADTIEKTQPAISKAKAKGEFPPGWAYLVGKKYGLLTEWIMTGEGPKRLDEKRKNSKFDLLNEFEEWLTEEVKKTPSRKEWFEIQLLDSFAAFKNWKEEKEESEEEKGSSSTRKVA